MTCIRCGTTLYDTDPAPLCDLCQQIEQEASAQYEAERDAMRRQAERARLSLSPAPAPAPAPHTELTPAGVAYLLPGIEPVHHATQPPGQARLL